MMADMEVDKDIFDKIQYLIHFSPFVSDDCVKSTLSIIAIRSDMQFAILAMY